MTLPLPKVLLPLPKVHRPLPQMLPPHRATLHLLTLLLHRPKLLPPKLPSNPESTPARQGANAMLLCPA